MEENVSAGISVDQEAAAGGSPAYANGKARADAQPEQHHQQSPRSDARLLGPNAQQTEGAKPPATEFPADLTHGTAPMGGEEAQPQHEQHHHQQLQTDAGHPPPNPQAAPGPGHRSSSTPTPASSSQQQQHQQPPVPHFVAPSSYLRPKIANRTVMVPAPEPAPAPTALDKEQAQGLRAIRDFLKARTTYDVMPLSFRLIVLDNHLLIKKSLNIMIQNAIVSAPLWDSDKSSFAGILTATDYINVIQYYCQFPDEMSKLDQFRLSSLREIETAIGAIPIETVSCHPLAPLYQACSRMLTTRARRIPLIDVDDETGKEMVLSVITQYRILKFIAVNNEHNTVLLKKTLSELKLGSYSNLAITHMNSRVLDVVQQMVHRNISSVPVVDEANRVLNVFEAVDIIPLIQGGAYEELERSVGEALCKRPDDSPGIYTCSEHDRLDAIFDVIRKSRVHRLIVVDDDNKLRGILSLSDILIYVLMSGDEDAGR